MSSAVERGVVAGSDNLNTKQDALSPAIAPFDATQARKHQEAWAQHLGIEVETTNSIGQTLVVIPPGKFTMGEGDRKVDVTLTKPFLLGQTEVTQGQWQRVMGSVPSNWGVDVVDENIITMGNKDISRKGADRPVEQVSWDDAAEFCRKLSALPEERQAGREYRLPTEVEWEYACRAGTNTKYSFGDDESRLGEYAWVADNSAKQKQTYPVAQKKPNTWGLFDMYGNVWEWCYDWYGEYPMGAVTDPRGPSAGLGRVFRGGSWKGFADCRSASRTGYVPSTRFNDLGFRLALSPPEAEPSPAAPTK